MDIHRYTVEVWGNEGTAPAPWWIVRRRDMVRVCECTSLEHAERIATALTILEQIEELGDTYRQVIARGHEQ